MEYVALEVKTSYSMLESLNDIKKLYRDCADGEKVLIDVKGLYKVDDLKKSGMRYWRL